MPFLATLACVLAFAASTPSAGRKTPDVLTAEEWRLALEERGVERPELQSPIEPDDAVRAAAQTIRDSTSGSMASLRKIQDLLFDPDRFGYDYYARRTLSAAETFAEARGNCVSFTNLFIAMGRALGVPVQAAMARIPRETETIRDLVIVNSHVVAVVPYATGRAVFDFDLNREIQPISYRIISDLELTAIYLNNLGAERLIADDPEEAISYFQDATRLAPEFAASHRNLGVALQRAGELGAALDATLLSLYYEPRNLSTRRNLLSLFATTPHDGTPADGETEPSPVIELLKEGDQALSDGQIDAASKLYRKAQKLDPRKPEVRVALARVELFRGRLRGAIRHLEAALRLDEDQPEALRLLRGLGRR